MRAAGVECGVGSMPVPLSVVTRLGRYASTGAKTCAKKQSIRCKSTVVADVMTDMASGLFAWGNDIPQVSVRQYCQKTGNTYAELTTALLPTGKVNLKHELAVTVKSNNSAVIDCVVEFPSCSTGKARGGEKL